jgi:3-oxoacyl-[acyl-carrier-protein] synthase III
MLEAKKPASSTPSRSWAVEDEARALPATISLAALGSYIPEKQIRLDFFSGGASGADPLANSPLLRAPELRHHVAYDETAAEMIEKAARPMFERLNLEPDGNVDLLITNVLLPDVPITGSGAAVAARLGCRPDWIIDLHNGGCASFAYMLKLTEAIVASGRARSALLCNVQNTAGRIFAQPELRDSPQAAVPGDGCGVAYIVAGSESPVLAVTTRNEPLYAGDMGMARADGTRYWEPGASQATISFNQNRFKEIVERGNRLVPEIVSALCRRIGVRPREIDVLVTNQPNRLFLRNWREALDIEPRRHLDTFDQFGNLYGAGVPVTLDHAIRTGDVRQGDLVVLAGFAHAGDFAAAAALRWRSCG